MAYTKLFQKILASSIWNEDVYTKVVWITMLAMKDQDQIVAASVGGLAHIARVTIEQCRRALATLEGPDPDDSSGVREGRRIEPLEHGGWVVINGKAYRDSKDEDERRAYMAHYMREYRKRKQNVNNCKPPLGPVNTAEQSRAEQNNISHESKNQGVQGDNGAGAPTLKPKRFKSRPESYEELKTYIVDKLELEEDDAAAIWEKWVGNGFKVNGKAMDSWKHTLSYWDRQRFFPSQKAADKQSPAFGFAR